MSVRVGTRGAVAAVAVSLVALALPLASLSANASEARIVVAGLTPVPTSDAIIHRAITTSFDLALTQRHPAALSAYITSLSNTGSANYHHYLTPAQYAERYGAPASSVDALRAYFKGYGLRVTSLSAGHDILHVTGTTTDIARAFDAPLETVRLSDGALDAHFTSSASLPHALASDVTAVAGLDTVTPLSTNLEVSRDVPAVATAGTCPAAGSSTGTTPNSVGGYTVQQQAAVSP
jgi:subtilase family serine protease